MSKDDVGRKVLIISSAVFIVMLGAGIVAPILPEYAKSFGASYSVVGLTISSFGFARIVGDVPSGSLSDRFGRRPIIILGILIFSVAGVLAAYAVDINFLILSRFVQGLGASIFTTAAMAHVADIIPVDRRGRYLGYYQGSFYLGSAVGPSLGGFLAELGGIRLPFLALSGLALSGAVVAYRSLAGPNEQSRETGKSVSFQAVLNHMLSTKPALVANFAAIVTFLMMSAIRFTAIPIFGQNFLGFGDAQIGVILSITALINFVLLRWSGPMVDRLGGLPSLSYGFLFSGIVVALFTFTKDFVSICLISVLFGITTSLIMPAQASLAVSASDPNHRGLSLGIYRIFSDIGIILGPITAGLVSDHLTILMSFYVVAGICIATAIAILSFHHLRF